MSSRGIYMTRISLRLNAAIILAAVALSSCTLHVIVERAAAADSPASDGPSRILTQNSKYAQIYFDSEPPLADVRLLFDGRNDQIDKILGTTPITIRLSPENNGPFDQSVCGRRLIILYEKRGYSGAKVSPKIVCHSTEASSENNPIEVVVKLAAQAVDPPASK